VTSAAAQPSENASPSYDDILARLASLHPKRIDLTLDRMWRILERLDHPERRIPPVIHVAGTNGKGSTVAFLRAILEAAGLRVHTYTSPHLVRFNERFRLGKVGGGVLVSDAQLRDALDHCERVNGGEPITIFEIETAAAFHLFAEHPADVVLLEVGLGGRLDATNVIEAPLASVITSIGMDHIEFLGDTLAKIATEKAGIIKRGVPVVCAEQQPDAEIAIEQAAKRMRAPLHAATQHWHVNVERGRLVYSDERGLLDLSAPRLFGRHQFDNAGLAIATLRAIESLKLEAAAFEQGIARAEWPARMQRLTSGTLVAFAPRDAEIWLDGGHNPDGGRVIAAALGDLEERVSRPLVVIAGMMGNKDAGGFLANFAGQTRHIIAVKIPDQDNAMEPGLLADAARQLGMRVEIAAGVEAALKSVARLAYEVPPRILITGSLYLAGHVLAENGTPPQ
jgi:dihydrofolate synthase/folylpolyglutamate synthase